jgi:enoyl-[acyl-carrier protein] reductase I
LDENSIAWKTAERIYEEGGVFVLTNAPASIRMGSIAELKRLKSFLLMRHRLLI